MNAFGAISGLRLNRKNQKLCGLVLQAKIRQILEFKCPKDPVKFLGTYLSQEETENNKII